jgi:hypothetical protein
MADVLGIQKEDIVESICSEEVNLYVKWEWELQGIIAKNFRGVPLVRSMHHTKGKVKRAVFCGTKMDADTARDVMEFAVYSGKKGAANFSVRYRKEWNTSAKGVSADYLVGYVVGISEGFHDLLVEDNRFALVAVVPEDVVQHCSTYEPADFDPPTLSEAAGIIAARALGYKDGYDASKYKPGAKELETEFAE